MERFDYIIIADMVKNGSKVLDLGSGDGRLLRHLMDYNEVKGVGIESDEKVIYESVRNGVTVEHADIDEALKDFSKGFFDYVIINFTLQETRHPNLVIREALRVGKKVIVSFPNFAYYKVRFSLGILGKTPRTAALPYRWDESPNLHYFTIKDFEIFCKEEKKVIERFVGFTGHSRIPFCQNLLAEKAVFMIA